MSIYYRRNDLIYVGNPHPMYQRYRFEYINDKMNVWSLQRGEPGWYALPLYHRTAALSGCLKLALGEEV